MQWIIDNLATIIISVALIGIVATIVITRIRSKRKGKSSCSSGCSSCSMNGICH